MFNLGTIDYLPCTTPLNMTITFDSQGEISLHPLDLTSQPPDNSKSEDCVGLIQTADSTLTPTSDIGDMILGVPFLRNTYTVMAYKPPNDDGSFGGDTSSDGIHPRLGLLGLTDPKIALQEFNTVRVLNEPLPSATSNGESNSKTTSGKKMSVGINILIGLVGFFGACIVLFVIWWFLIKRRAVRAETGNGGEKTISFAPYRLARRQSNPSLDNPSSMSTLRSSRVDDIKKNDMAELGYNESGHYRRSSASHGKLHDVNDPWDPRNYSMAFRDSVYEPESFPASHSPEPPPEVVTRPDHQRTTSELRNSPQSVMVPLLARPHRESPSDDLAEFGVYDMTSMAGVGTAARGSKFDTDFHRSRMGSAGSNFAAGSSPSQRLSLSPRPPRPTSKIYPPSTETDVGHEF